MKVILLALVLLGAVFCGEEWSDDSKKYSKEDSETDWKEEPKEDWKEGSEKDWRDDSKNQTYCDDGERLSESDLCDDYCDCTGCEDELSCEDGAGVTRVDLGGISMSLNLKHDGGKFGFMTQDLIVGVVNGVFECILHGDCPW